MRRKLKPAYQTRLPLIVLILGILFIAGGITVIKTWYSASLKPLSSSSQVVNFTVKSGDSVKVIGANLQKAEIIRSGKAFETYVRANPFDRNLQAGTYALSASMNVRTIAHKIASGAVARNFLTILPDKRLEQIKQAFAVAGYSSDEISSAFNPAAYKGHPALASLSAGASLEGYLYPESFQQQADTRATTIVRKSLDEMNKHLTPDLVQGFAVQKLTTFQAITLASIVNQETDDAAYQPIVAQVFYSRLRQNIALGSDVTAFYASAMAGTTKSVGIKSPYNTRLYPGLPPGPIGNVTANSLNAVAYPSSTNYLFFVAGDDKKLYFSHTVAEHEQAIAAHCKLGCGH